MNDDKRKTYSCPGLIPVRAHTKGEARAAFKQQLVDLSNLTFHPQKYKRLPVGFTVMKKKEETT